MRRDESIRKVLILGSGALKIGEAGEFDYSGSQAIKSLKEEDIHVVLVNPNIATIQTTDYLADKIYFLPVTPEFVEQVMEREKVDAILLSFGGQTALNCGVELFRRGAFERLGVRVLGTSVQSIIETEDRELFKQRLHQIIVDTPRSQAVTSEADALSAAESICYPVMVRAAFALGGQGSGVAHNSGELRALVRKAMTSVPQVLIEEYLEGWKEIEYEVVRDASDNCITVCNMENLDPMGIHTGESIVVAPSQTLTNREYHLLRAVSLKIVRALGIVGECNVQFALSPLGEEYRVIELNARLSRSSALASKATGYPLAYVAAKLALGCSLPEIPNKLTGVTQACFEPALDYVVVKIPRWDLQKFERVSRTIGSEMKSVGEVMGIARTFEEALQKGIRMLDIGAQGVLWTEDHEEELELHQPTDRRIFAIAHALSRGETVEEIHRITRIDPWFLLRVQGIVELARELESASALQPGLVREAKRRGFSDRQIASYLKVSEEDVRSFRREHGILPVVKQIDTLASEYPAATNYLYLTYGGQEHDILPSRDSGEDAREQKGTVIVLGSGPYRIGSSVEFDWCCVSAAMEAKKLGHRTVIINNNPETVSTDFDEADSLYFEELTPERVRDICELESPMGVIVSMGGQTPNNIALPLHRAGFHILGTSPHDIDRAEDRHKFSRLCDDLAIDQPDWKELTSIDEARGFAERVGYPVLIRPSYVLSGSDMKVAYHPQGLESFLGATSKVSPEHPVVVSKFIHNAKEIEIDAVASEGIIILSAVSEHIENAGIHSGDATIVLPPQKAYAETIRQMKVAAERLAKALKISGPFNIQCIAKDNQLKVIECNLRASRSFPFVSKVLGTNFASLATRALLGGIPQGFQAKQHGSPELPYVGVKSAQFSYGRLRGAFPRLGVEMGSTGEVACLGDDLHEALLKSVLSTGFSLPKKGVLLSISGDANRHRLLEEVALLHAMGYTLFGTENTARFYRAEGIPVATLHKIHEQKSPNVQEYLEGRKIDLVIHIDRPHQDLPREDDYVMCRMTTDFAIPLVQNAQLAKSLVRALSARPTLHVKSWDEYVASRERKAQ